MFQGASHQTRLLTPELQKHEFGESRSPGFPDVEFINFLDEWFENVVNKNNKFILIGDFNINIKKNSTYSSKLMSVIENYGLKQFVKDFTRVTMDSRTLIDLVISNQKKLKVTKPDIAKISDHDLLNIECEFFNINEFVQPFVEPREIKLWEKIQKEDLKDYLKTCNWEGNGLHEMSDIFVANLSLAVKKFVPVKIIHPNKEIVKSDGAPNNKTRIEKEPLAFYPPEAAMMDKYNNKKREVSEPAQQHICLNTQCS
ncbi:hypothetical protein J437_LFUL017036 [Ladona fulva]|uniref:Endonuclease/exonuclease/phosphatase domain-containing protein n=1 Tax=Ladona fulva TaxID=123851 RepID=A0A8K0KPG8_LADFU|nr:hypothetical protein J437_LFUL017036 [Ladona fulva]